ncbi:MAG: A/G-specific adenine glycosylase [Terriglobales bacterium]
MMIARRIPVETRLAASRITTAPSRVKSAISAKDDKDLDRFRRALLGWYDQHCRDLPWRETRDPYRIWLSEIMLQQTRVAAVLDHYRIFLERFPNVQALAAATEEAVLAAWSGLGYYRRARMMHQCARQIAEQHGGRFPQDSASLRALPGIGRYTAAAIASIAFAEPVAVVDGNVERVLQRLIRKKTTGINLTTPQTWQHAQGLLAENRPGDFNQAMMELGATVCLPREPRCPACPVRKWCATQGEHPRNEPPSRQNKKQIWCALEWRNGKGRSDGNGRAHGKANGNGRRQIRLVQRPKKASLMPGMWELPQSSEPPRAVPATTHWRTFRHSITVTDYTVHVFEPACGRDAAPLPHKTANGKWIAIDRLPQLPITGLTRKILRAGGII